MNHVSALFHRTRALPAAILAAVLALGMIALVSSGSATANKAGGGPDVPPPPAVPVRAGQIQNIDQVKTAIKGYYGDTISGTNYDGTPQHLPSPTSNYAKEMAKIEKGAAGYLDYAAYSYHNKKIKKAVVFDIDDTTLNTYNYEIFSNFVYNPTTNAAFVNGAAFPAVFGMPKLVQRAVKDGYTIFFLTGRPVTQLAGTVTNLKNVGYPSVPADQLYLKDLSAPWLSSCATTTPACTTIQYKSLTRAHIQSLGYKIIANFGDQYSDLTGGYAKKDFKLPNPMYYLP